MKDFNNVLEEKYNVANVSPYKVKDFENCCLNVGLTDVRSIRCFYNWTNNLVWSKIERSIVNAIWMQAILNSFIDFLPQGCYPTTLHALYYFVYKTEERANHLDSLICGLVMKNLMI